ncbi:hypothetical protein D3C75_831750 [compost metagenome]
MPAVDLHQEDSQPLRLPAKLHLLPIPLGRLRTDRLPEQPADIFLTEQQEALAHLALHMKDMPLSFVLALQHRFRLKHCFYDIGEGKWLFHKIERPQADRLFGIFKIRVGAQDDDLAAGVNLQDAPGHLQAVHLRHPNVSDDNIRVPLGNQPQPGLAVPRTSCDRYAMVGPGNPGGDNLHRAGNIVNHA